MFGLGTGELLFILLLVLLIYGPDRVPEMARKLGKAAREVRSMGENVRTAIDREVAKRDEPDSEEGES